jgi:transglutaminase-like putative cysteine protease
MKYRIRHETSFDYELPVTSSHQLLRMQPCHLQNRQHLPHHQITLSESDAEVVERNDYFGNSVHEVRLHSVHRNLAILSECEVEIFAKDEILVDLSPAWEGVARALKLPANDEQWNAAQFCYSPQLVDARDAREFAQDLQEAGMPVLRLALMLNERIYRDFTYQQGVTDISTSVSEVLQRRTGVCQDFAHTAIATMRSLGLAARYVSGYILGSANQSELHLVGAQASHAWMSVYCPDFGWVDFDPTNNQVTYDQHITVGLGRDYSDVAPSRGSILGGGKQTLEVDVRVDPVYSA